MRTAWIGDDPRYDTREKFTAHSQVAIQLACIRMDASFGQRYFKRPLFVDCDPDGDIISVWVDERGPTVGLYITYVDRFLNDEEVAPGLTTLIDQQYRIILRLNSYEVDWKAERAIWTAIAEAFECQLQRIYGGH